VPAAAGAFACACRRPAAAVRAGSVCARRKSVTGKKSERKKVKVENQEHENQIQQFAMTFPLDFFSFTFPRHFASYGAFSTCFVLAVSPITLSPTSDGVSGTRHQKIIFSLA